MVHRSLGQKENSDKRFMRELHRKMVDDKDFADWLRDMNFNPKEQPDSTENTLLGLGVLR